MGFFIFFWFSNSALRMNKVRLEIIKKKRNAVEKYLKNDIAELLRNGLDYNAYGRVITFVLIWPLFSK